MGSNQSSVSRRNRYPSKSRKAWRNLRIAGSPAVRGHRSEIRRQNRRKANVSGDNETTGPLTTRPQSREEETLDRKRRTPNVELRNQGAKREEHEGARRQGGTEDGRGKALQLTVIGYLARPCDKIRPDLKGFGSHEIIKAAVSTDLTN